MDLLRDQTRQVRNIECACIVFQAATIAVLYLVFFWRFVPGLVSDWRTYEMFSHGYVVPFISAYLIWDRRIDLQLLPMMSSLSGAILLGLIMLLGLSGEALANDFAVRVSMVLALGASIYLLFGIGFTRALAFPVLYLVLMIPLPFIVMKELTYNLRMYISICSEALLRVVGVPVFRDSYFLHLPNITLEVADGCSGVGSLFALFTLAVVYAFFLPISRIARVSLAISAVPIAVFTNLFRVFVTATLAYHIGPIVLSTPFHYPYGAFNFVIGLGLIIVEGQFLRKRFARFGVHDVLDSHTENFATRSSKIAVRWTPFIVGVLIFAIANWYSTNVKAVAKPAPQADLGEVFSSLDRAYSVADRHWPDPYEDRKADNSISKVYRGVSEIPVEVFISYRGAQRAVNRLQSPKVTLPEGWYLVWVKPTVIKIDRIGEIRANWMLVRKGTAQRLVMYWYQLHHKSFSGEFAYRLELIARNLLGGRTDGAVIRMATPLSDSEVVEVDQAEKRLISVAQRLYPELLKTLL